MTTPALDTLHGAALAAGINTNGAQLIRDGSNTLYRLPGRIVARIGPAETHDSARFQVEVARLLAGSGLPVTIPLDDVPQPAATGPRPVTWWHELPDHRPATPAELGGVLRALHRLSAPTTLALPVFDPFTGIEPRLRAATHVASADQTWLLQHLADLRAALAEDTAPRPRSVIHGDAWQGNVAVSRHGTPTPTLLDLEHIALGDPDWDLIPLAADHSDFDRIPDSDYRDFVDAYGGHDVATIPAFRAMADTLELRWIAFILGKPDDTKAVTEAHHRIACLRGEIARPWTWSAF